VVASIIGTKGFSYDLWGDTVNIASLMESSAAVSTIPLTNATGRLVGSSFGIQPRGVIDVKGAGEMTVWRLVDSRSPS
jgi:class 3 adenylate cyclase